jgi:exopolyphosphatase/guanosine-5'-triphosphate,3'-diphosphate pyrophosphatase
MHARNVRVVGTNALRISRRKQAFLERARDALGHPIEIISGMEEARLIYAGVAHTLPAEPGRRLVIDIGSGSTEIVIGEGHEPQPLESLKPGCVSMSLRFFPDGNFSVRLAAHALAARAEIEPVQAASSSGGWERVVGSPGTVRAITEVPAGEQDPQRPASPPPPWSASSRTGARRERP